MTSIGSLLRHLQRLRLGRTLAQETPASILPTPGLPESSRGEAEAAAAGAKAWQRGHCRGTPRPRLPHCRL